MPLLFIFQSFGDLIALAEKGDHREVDLLVKDTAGSDYHIISADNMVSSFGKPAKDKMQGKGKKQCLTCLLKIL